MRTIVIGGGPAGIISALHASESGDQVILLEKMNSIRKKIINYW